MCGLKENSNRMSQSRKYSCEMTAISSFYSKINLSMPLFSLVYFWLSWGYVVLFVVFLFYSMTKKPEKNFSFSVRESYLIIYRNMLEMTMRARTSLEELSQTMKTTE